MNHRANALSKNAMGRMMSLLRKEPLVMAQSTGSLARRLETDRLFGIDRKVIAQDARGLLSRHFGHRRHVIHDQRDVIQKGKKTVGHGANLKHNVTSCAKPKQRPKQTKRSLCRKRKCTPMQPRSSLIGSFIYDIQSTDLELLSSRTCVVFMCPRSDGLEDLYFTHNGWTHL